MKLTRLVTGAVSVSLALSLAVTPALAFTDVPTDHWAYSTIQAMEDRGVISGIGDDMFAPSAQVTRAELLTMLVREFKYGYYNYNQAIFDSQLSQWQTLFERGFTTAEAEPQQEWYASYITAAYEGGFISYADQFLDQTAPLNRYEMAKILFDSLEGSAPADFDPTIIPDWDEVPEEYQEAVSACYALGLLSGMDEAGTFCGTAYMTRAEAAIVMQHRIDYVPEASEPPVEGLEPYLDASAIRSSGYATVKIGTLSTEYDCVDGLRRDVTEEEYLEALENVGDSWTYSTMPMDESYFESDIYHLQNTNGGVGGSPTYLVINTAGCDTVSFSVKAPVVEVDGNAYNQTVRVSGNTSFYSAPWSAEVPSDGWVTYTVPTSGGTWTYITILTTQIKYIAFAQIRDIYVY